MLTQRIFWVTIASAVAVTGLIGYQVVRVTDRLGELPKLQEKIAATPKQPARRLDETAHVAAPAIEDSKKLTRDVAIYLQLALKALKTEPTDFENARTHLINAEQVGKKTTFDLFKTDEIWSYYYWRAKNFPQVLTVYEALTGDPKRSQYLSAEQLSEKSRTLVLFAAATNNHAKVVEHGERWLTQHPNDVAIAALLTQHHYHLKNWERCGQVAATAIFAAEASQQATPESLLRFQIACLSEAGKDLVPALERLCRTYPRPENWNQYIRSASRNTRSAVAVHFWESLRQDVRVPMDAADYNNFAYSALADVKLPASAARAMERGFAQGVFAKPRDRNRATALLNRAKETAASNRDRIESLTKEASTDATGQKKFELGLIFFDNEHYEQAVEHLRRSLERGATESSMPANMAIGISLFKSGDRAGARSAFTVVAANKELKPVADAWIARTYNE